MPSDTVKQSLLASMGSAAAGLTNTDRNIRGKKSASVLNMYKHFSLLLSLKTQRKNYFHGIYIVLGMLSTPAMILSVCEDSRHFPRGSYYFQAVMLQMGGASQRWGTPAGGEAISSRDTLQGVTTPYYVAECPLFLW